MEAEKKIILTITIIAVVIIGAIIIFDYYQKERKIKEEFVETEEGYLPRELAEGVNTIDPTIPADFEPKIDKETMRRYVKEAEEYYKGDENKEIREYMLSEIAQIALDPEPCEKISSPEIRDSCYFGVAIESNNSELCEIITDGKSECFYQVAINTNNYELCEKADYEYQICLEAARKKDMNLCKQVGDFKQYCVAAAFPGCDNKTFQYGTCTDIGDSLPPGNISECEKIPKYKVSCYELIARNTNNASLCSKSADKDGCYNHIGIETNNINLCNLAGSLKYNCIAAIAYNTKDIKLCEYTNYLKDECKKDVMFAIENGE